MSNRKHILFVDDEPDFLKGLQRMLFEQEQWDLHFVTHVDDALEKIYQINFDTIVADVSMPGKDGFDLLRILQDSKATRYIPVIILTGMDEHKLKRRALEFGAADLLNKPVVCEDLHARLNSVLQLKSYQDELREQNELLQQNIAERTIELDDSRLDTILCLGKASEFRDEETGNHILRVGCYSSILAEELEMDQEYIETILLASPLHDIGKIGIPDKILLKKGKLTVAERKIIERHCKIGTHMLRQKPEKLKTFLSWCNKTRTPDSSNNPFLKMASTIALDHHEHWDGSGYPRGLQGNNIPLAARIVSVADVYDALRSVRPYKQAFSEQKTLEIMKSLNGTKFDPRVFEAFENILDKFDSIFKQFSDEKTNAKQEKHSFC